MLPDDVEAIVFDLYGTLLDVEGLEATVQQALPGVGGLVRLWRAKQLEYAFIRTLACRYIDFWAVTGDALDDACARLALTLDPAARDHLMDGWNRLEPFPDVVPALDALSVRPLAVLSNGSPTMLERALTAGGLRSRFGHVLSTDLVQRFKPDPAVYALAPGHLMVPARRLLFVSGNGFDVAGAGQFGMRVARLDRAGTPLDRLGVEPDMTLRSLHELAS
ncbi:MAG TPA: haloacid dehalogenase type II [Thermomicrobiaceae bacterium]|nr:haloacid dehalogenase type II [Thermomicrobiaceae bacterium]